MLQGRGLMNNMSTVTFFVGAKNKLSLLQVWSSIFVFESWNEAGGNGIQIFTRIYAQNKPKRSTVHKNFNFFPLSFVEKATLGISRMYSPRQKSQQAILMRAKSRIRSGRLRWYKVSDQLHYVAEGQELSMLDSIDVKMNFSYAFTTTYKYSFWINKMYSFWYAPAHSFLSKSLYRVICCNTTIVADWKLLRTFWE